MDWKKAKITITILLILSPLCVYHSAPKIFINLLKKATSRVPKLMSFHV